MWDHGVKRLNVHCIEKALTGVIVAKLKTIKDLKCVVRVLYVCFEIAYEWRHNLVQVRSDAFGWATTRRNSWSPRVVLLVDLWEEIR